LKTKSTVTKKVFKLVMYNQ